MSAQRTRLAPLHPRGGPSDLLGGLLIMTNGKPVDRAVVGGEGAGGVATEGIESRVSVRRYLKAMFAATARSECLGLILLAARPDDVEPAPDGTGAEPLGETLGPYLGLARPSSEGPAGAGVMLPEGIRVLADGLDAQCWPGSEAAFRAELAERSPTSWDHAPRGRHSGSPDVAGRAAAEIAWYLGLDGRDLPAVAVLDPTARRGVMITLPRRASMWAFGRRLVEELGGWPNRRLAVVTELMAERLEQAMTRYPQEPALLRLHAQYTEDRREPDEHRRAVAMARCSDTLRAVEERIARTRADGDGDGRTAVISELRNELDRCDRASSAANAAVRAARGEFGDLRTRVLSPPEALADWRFEQLSAPGLLERLFRRNR